MYVIHPSIQYIFSQYGHTLQYTCTHMNTLQNSTVHKYTCVSIQCSTHIHVCVYMVQYTYTCVCCYSTVHTYTCVYIVQYTEVHIRRDSVCVSICYSTTHVHESIGLWYTCTCIHTVYTYTVRTRVCVCVHTVQ